MHTFSKKVVSKNSFVNETPLYFFVGVQYGVECRSSFQNQRVSVKLKNAGIEDLIVAIKSQCDMGFLYDYGKTKAVKNITVSMQNALLADVLRRR